MPVLNYSIQGDNSGLLSAIKQSINDIGGLTNSVVQSNKNIQNEIVSLASLKKELGTLNAQKLNIIDSDQLAKQNLLIQELEAEINRFKNIGKVGFDSTGIAIKSFGNDIQEATGTIGGLGKGLTSSFGYLRQIAYILPGIGIAGIFNLGFEAISKATNELGLFNSKITVAQSNLSNLNEVSQNASKQYGEQATNLRVLYAAATDVNNSEKDRLLAVRELQKEFPDYFKNISTEKILNGDSSKIYQQLTVDILENAKAKAAATKISELAAKQLQADFQIQKINNAESNESARAKNNTFQSGQFSQGRVGGEIASNLADIKGRADAARKIQAQNKKDLQDQIDFLTQYAGGNNKIAQALSTKNTPSVQSTENTFGLLTKQLDDVISKSDHLADESGLTGYALQVQKITDKYIDLNRQIDEVIHKAASDLKAGKITPSQFGVITTNASNDKAELVNDRNKQLSDAKIAEATRVSNEVQRINNEFGVKSEQSRAKELASITKLYDQEVVKANGNAELIAAADNGRLEAIQAINDKYAALQSDLYTKIGFIEDQALAETKTKEETVTDKIGIEWEKRRKQANDYYEQIKKLQDQFVDPTGLLPGDIIKGIQSLINTPITNKQKTTNTAIDLGENAAKLKAANQQFTDALSRSVAQFGQDFYNTLSSVDTYAKGTFESIFSDLTHKLTTSLNSVLLGTFSKLLSDALKKGIGGLFDSNGKITTTGGIAAGAALAGGIISATTSQTSTVGQGIGGALSGAGTGALIGTAIVPGIGTAVGAVLGGAIGLLGGIFGASKAQKELQEQQLAEQQQQTALLKASVAYTSQVIGRMTENGVITDIGVGSTGQLTATVNGKDLQFVLDRYKNGR